MTLAHLRNGDTYRRLSAGFRIGTSTVYRYLREAIDPIHDVRAAREHGIPAALVKFGVAAYADAAYQAAGRTIAVPYRRHPKP